MLPIVIIEDEPQAAQRLERLIKEIVPAWMVLAKLDSIQQAVQWFKTNDTPALAFMDIHLGDGLSFEIFDQIEINCPVIFTTAYDQYAIKAFKVNSIDYLLKPIDPDELRKAIAKFTKIEQQLKSPDHKAEAQRITMIESISKTMEMLLKKYKSRFVIKVGEHLRSVETVEILFFFSQDKATIAQTKDGRKHIVDFSMEQLEEMTDPARFFRINRKYLIASDSIQDMIHHTSSRLRLVLKTCDDKDVIVARERVQAFKDWLDR